MKDKKIEQIDLLIQSTYRNLEKIHKLLNGIEDDLKKEDYKKIPGVEGMFDGVSLVADDGTKHDVPANYAAKSRLVYSDRLKMIEENGKSVFKQVEKVDRKKVTGVIAKKEGKWFVLTDSGSYRILDVAAEYNKAELNDKAEVLIPATNNAVPYAALDKIIKTVEKPAEVVRAPAPKIDEPEKLKRKPVLRRPILKKKPESKPFVPIATAVAVAREEPQPQQGDTVKTILLDDDLR